MKVALLTGGKDPHYAQGLARQLATRGVSVEIVGSPDEMVALSDAVRGEVMLHNLVGSQKPGAGWGAKIARVLIYFVRLAWFAARSDARLFHILWFRKFPRVERLVLPLYLKLLGKKLVFTAHNVDDRARDGSPNGFIQGWSLRLFYRLLDHVFVHTVAMKDELLRSFGLANDRVTVVPLGINDVVPVVGVTRADARQKLGLAVNARILLFFGNIAPYKGLEDLIEVLAELSRDDSRFLLMIVGRVKDRASDAYWRAVEGRIAALNLADYVHKEIRYVTDSEASLFFRAADVTVLPYRRVYQSGVLGLSYAQGIPVIAADVGSMRDDIIDGETGLLFRAGDVIDLSAKIRGYFVSPLFEERDARRSAIADHGSRRFSWFHNAERTYTVYTETLR